MDIKDIDSIIDNTTSQYIPVIDAGTISYCRAFNIQSHVSAEIFEKDRKGIIMLLEHTPVITIGSNRSMENLLTPADMLDKLGIELVNSNRGGDITLHGPGQIVCYPILNLRYFGKDLSLFVYSLEQIILDTLTGLGIKGRRIDKHRGIFIKNKKIASIGIRVKKWISMHGFSLNVNIDLSYFKHIIACGLKDFPQTSISSLLKKNISINYVKEQIISNFETVLNISAVKIDL